MASPIIPRLVRGRLYFQTADVLFPTFKQAATAWSAAEAHRLDTAEPLADTGLLNEILDTVIAARLGELEGGAR